jgi:protein TonB
LKLYLVISLAVHSAIIGGLIWFSNAKSSEASYPQVYRVNLISAAPPPMKVQPPPRTKTVSRPAPKTESRPEGLTVQKKTNKRVIKERPEPRTTNVKKNPASAPKNQSYYPEFLDNIDFGSEFGGILIDDAGFQSSYYINLIFAKIRSRWSNPIRLSEVIDAVIYFRVESDGSVSSAEIERSSGIDVFDQSALRAILKSDPLPPLPQDFSGDHIGIHLKFEYTP